MGKDKNARLVLNEQMRTIPAETKPGIGAKRRIEPLRGDNVGWVVCRLLSGWICGRPDRRGAMLDLLGRCCENSQDEQRQNLQPVARIDLSPARRNYHFDKYKPSPKRSSLQSGRKRPCEENGHKADSARADWTISRTRRARRSAARGTAFGSRDDGICVKPGP